MSTISPEVEYQEKWTYLRHLEESRRKSVQLFFVLVGGVGSYLVGLGWELTITSITIFVGASTFLTTYATCLLAFLLTQKVEYARHLARIDALDGYSMGDLDRGEGTFAWFYRAVLVVGAALIAVLVWMMVAGLALAATGTRSVIDLNPVAILAFFFVASVAGALYFRGLEREMEEILTKNAEGVFPDSVP